MAATKFQEKQFMADEKYYSLKPQTDEDFKKPVS